MVANKVESTPEARACAGLCIVVLDVFLASLNSNLCCVNRICRLSLPVNAKDIPRLLCYARLR